MLHAMFPWTHGGETAALVIGGASIAMDRSTLAFVVDTATSGRWADALLSSQAVFPADYGGFAAAADGCGAILLYGGGAGSFNDEPPPLWRAEPDTGIAIRLDNDSPDPLLTGTARAGAAYDGRRSHLYVVGGTKPPAWASYQRAWRYDLDAGQWEDLDDGAHDAPHDLSNPGVAWLRLRDRLVVFGGDSDTDGISADLWLFDPWTEQWQRHRAGSAVPWPAPRWGHAFIPSADGSSAVVFGGANGTAEGPRDVWRFVLECP